MTSATLPIVQHCPKCHGSGRTWRGYCRTCQGAGSIDTEYADPSIPRRYRLILNLSALFVPWFLDGFVVRWVKRRTEF